MTNAEPTGGLKHGEPTGARKSGERRSREALSSEDVRLYP
jgi:hypothetical protein